MSALSQGPFLGFPPSSYTCNWVLGSFHIFVYRSLKQIGICYQATPRALELGHGGDYILQLCRHPKREPSEQEHIFQ